MFDHDSRREDARAESLPMECPECGYTEPHDSRNGRYECPLCTNDARCPECGWCLECQESVAARPTMSPLGQMLFDIGAAMMLADAARYERRAMVPLGGRAWRCLRCQGVVMAACECCEPPACNCGR